ncbi:MAG: GTP 3',8-cyclase MoaA [Nitrospinae bacterium]|nr:GTP 3',8-cyclase MoaA [Nitrospinota bacterium]MBF0634495.1 GTP 3',8-cyclase MoaA [Nitrospinota bacterium]
MQENATTPLIDRFNRRIEYLRMSVTSRCNLSCSYCVPAGKLSDNGGCDMLSFRDLLFIADVFARLGVRKVRVTGGEPLVRKGIEKFIAQLAETPGIDRLALTTNGVMLAQMAHSLKSAGLKAVNVSLDTFDREKYARVTGHDGLNNVLSGLNAAIDAGIESVKLNVVVMKGVNDDELEKFAGYTIRNKIQVRFIEFMPHTKGAWNAGQYMPVEDVKKRIEALGALIPCSREQWGGPARIYRLDGAQGEIGFISAVSRHFCWECNRLRITADGKLLTCLFEGSALDLRSLLESGASAERISTAIKEALMGKWEARPGFDSNVNDAQGQVAMRHIGG